MLRTLLCFAVVVSLVSGIASAKPPKEEEEFRQKLVQMLQRAEKSEKILRQQITESQTAPFLPDLYLQLAQLLSDRSNTLYYIQMEKRKGSDAPLDDKEASPVVAAQKEAIATYKLILKDFPTFGKRKQILYRLALAEMSIDEHIEFMRMALQVVKEYPDSEEAMGSRLLLGQYYFDKGQYRDAVAMLSLIAKSSFVYERNLAKYRIGLIDIAQDRFRDALTEFEQVISDNDLKEQDNPYDVTLKNKRSRSDLKREALIDSIRAYTHVFESHADPVPYYSKLAPTEVHFQEVIEKLALRYINLKKYDSAIKLLRTLSERTVEPQKVINIYHEVLLMIPVADRRFIPVEEMRFLIEKYNLWTAYYKIPHTTQEQSYQFFEKQVRDFGTSAHSMAKAEQRGQEKAVYLKRARDFYLLYLAYFRKTKDSVKMATNLADVYYALQEYPESGDYYIRIFHDEFGPATDKKALIENAILCLQKKGNYSFYENVRMRGLLIKSIESYMAFDKRKKNDPDLAFLLVKTQYEQGFFPESLNKLYTYSKTFPKTRHAIDAGELILDYFNTRTDYAGLDIWSEKLLAAHLPNNDFNQKLARIKKQAKSKFIQEKVRAVAGYDDFQEGKGYLTVALGTGDVSLKNLALKEALNRSKRERDIQTFLKAAFLMADNEPDRDKKFEILKSVANEHIKVTQFYRALGVLHQVYDSAKFSSKARLDAFEEAANLALLLKDWHVIQQVLRNPLWASAPAPLKTRVKEQLSDLIESPAEVPAELVSDFLKMGISDDNLLSLYKAQYKLGPVFQKTILSQVQRHCTQGAHQTVCLWNELPRLDGQKAKFTQALHTGPPQLASIQSFAQQLMSLIEVFRPLEGSGDAQLDALGSAKEAGLYNAFGQYLSRAADTNPDMKQILLQKAKETFASGKAYEDRCKQIADKTPSIHDCSGEKAVGARDVLPTATVKAKSEPTSDPSSDKIEESQKTLFAGASSGEAMLGLAREYLEGEHYRHASAAAAYGISLYKDQEGDFQAVLGCSVLSLGLYNKARFHLKNASNYGGLGEKCKKKLDSLSKSVS